MNNKTQYVDRIIWGLLLAYPILLLTVKGGMNASLILLAAVSIYALLNFRVKLGDVFDCKAKLFALAMGATFISVFASELSHWEGSARAFDTSSRFLLAIPVFLVLRTLRSEVLSVVQYAFPIGALIIGLLILMSGQEKSAASYFLMHIHLGDLALMLGLLSIFSLHWSGRDSYALQGLKVVGLLGGLYVSLVSGARGGWAAIPVVLTVWIILRFSGKGLVLKLGAMFAAIILISALSYATVNIIHARVDAAINDIQTADPDSSLGVRIQLWKAASILFVQNPIFGVGPDGFGSAMDSLMESGVITPVAAEIGKGEVHSYYFAVLARYGLLGILSVLMLIGLPIWMFLKVYRAEKGYKQVASRMGIVLVLGFAVFGITVEMFNLKMVASFYGLTVAVLLAAALNSNNIDQQRG